MHDSLVAEAIYCAGYVADNQDVGMLAAEIRQSYASSLCGILC